VSQRLKLLIVSSRFLFPLDEGGKIRTANILRGMKGGRFELQLVSPAPPHAARFAADISAICDRFISWPSLRASRLRRLRALAGHLPVSAATDYSRTGKIVIDRALRNGPDLLLVDFPQTAVLLPQQIGIPSIIFTHNVEAEILRRHAALARGLWRSLWASQARKMRAFEATTLRGCNCAVAVSERDANVLRREYGLAVVKPIDTGIDLDFYAFSSTRSASLVSPSGGTIVFVGAMDWAANIDGVGFLIDDIWPRVMRKRQQARAIIVGRNPPMSLVAKSRNMGARFTFTGYVHDVRPYVAGSHVFVIPLRIASGTRIKAFEAMALGRPVVSTRIGVEGLDITEGEHFLAADDPVDFADAILKLLDDAELREGLAQAARARLEERFSWGQVARQLEDICLATLTTHRGVFS
jgi:glycosyltransferase involved in cell wall biosynthesis